MQDKRFSRSEFLALSSLLAGSTLFPTRGDAAPDGGVAPVRAAASTAAARAPDGGVAVPAQPTQAEFDQLRKGCTASLSAGSTADDGAEYVRIGEWMQRQKLSSDVYGNGDFVQAFEKRVADMLGFEDACFMPTGTMGQLIALRIYADASGVRTVGVHPSSHHVLHEDDSYAVLHQLRAVYLGPWTRPLLAEDVAQAREPLGTVSLELPVRWLGGQLPTWEQLAELKRTCRERKVKLHMDGARLWETQPFYGRSYADICKGFDSVYVSFYKMVGGIGGAMLAGSRDFIRESRLWRHRHGGNLYQLAPYVASAAMRLDPALAAIPGYVKRAKAVTALLAADPRVTVLPQPVQTNMFHVFLRGSPGAFNRQRDRIAREDKVWVAGGFGQTRVPGVVSTELQVGEGLGRISDADAARVFLRLLEAN
ncbi:beta-eliminating lyase-related protein [Corallococcus sp. bb12-1]|uniref:threonine aldolase family protein n=1 Tax=Corallococcus sp. bb12-1 TaxID=2996784 RepID=UPI00226F2DAE|nr:beta-eliminating lyase-related protein [Corallococcus sp. bb12-1]MCY1044206.1 beta-eliminating lyase-related protein [Corallococcus sp. bb12-1]